MYAHTFSHQQQYSSELPILAMEELFHFSLLRVSIAQILKSCGFDKCKPSTLNIVTDLYIHYFTKLVREAITCSQLRTKLNQVSLEDVSQLLILIGGIKPKNFLGNDPVPQTRENYDYNTKLVELFLNWLRSSDQYRILKQLDEVPIPLLSNLIEKRKLDLSDIDADVDRKKQKYKERQEFYNQLKLNNDDVIDDEEVTENDRMPWVNYLVEKDLKLGHDLKFLNTPLFSEYTKYQSNTKFHPSQKHNKHLQSLIANHDKNDYLIPKFEANPEGDDQILPLEELQLLLPCNLTYSEDISGDLSPEAIKNLTAASKSSSELRDDSSQRVESQHTDSRDMKTSEVDPLQVTGDEDEEISEMSELTPVPPASPSPDSHEVDMVTN